MTKDILIMIFGVLLFFYLNYLNEDKENINCDRVKIASSFDVGDICKKRNINE